MAACFKHYRVKCPNNYLQGIGGNSDPYWVPLGKRTGAGHVHIPNETIVTLVDDEVLNPDLDQAQKPDFRKVDWEDDRVVQNVLFYVNIKVLFGEQICYLGKDCLGSSLHEVTEEEASLK